MTSQPQSCSTTNSTEGNMPTYFLSVTEYNSYTKTIEAADPAAAIAKAQELWEAEGPDAFDWRKGAIEHWECSSEQEAATIGDSMKPAKAGGQQ
jgi:hypothetical protein